MTGAELIDVGSIGSAMVVGFAVTGRAVTAALRARGITVVATDDHPSERMRTEAASMAVELLERPDAELLSSRLSGVDAVLPSPGIPAHHPVFDLARQHGVPVLSEFDLAAAWDERPIVAITGTDGKTTVTTMVTEMLEESGRRAVACGNTDTPVVTAIDDPAIEVLVVEASSFRLGHSQRFRPTVAVWLNFSPDHLDAHGSLVDYEAAKARIWSDLDPEVGVAVANATDPVVLANRNPAVRTITFGGDGTGADATVVDGELRLPDGTSLLAIDELPRALPHDITNSLAAAVAALAAGADIEAVRRVLRRFRGLPHRVELVAEIDGVAWFDDSKATTPHAVLAAVAGFDSVVLIAGGRNKGLDLSVLATAVPPVRAVVAIGESAAMIAAAFEGRCPTTIVDTSMTDAVAAAAARAEQGDVVLLSPGCASFDWFRSYSERGEVFAAAVHALDTGARR
ncbi:MAG: UDP-N-acetylmuramoyl-L-alanine--D-glutamate ligase [Acidobacteria bacterium]|nr:UDP-N-acetylmuramoyl-L-alanine--D-glutamate ligase [Acidobacteriota bacterium]